LEKILGEKVINDIAMVFGAGFFAGGTIASIGYLGRYGKIKSTLNRNFPSSGSLNLSPVIVLGRYMHLICPGFTLTYRF